MSLERRTFPSEPKCAFTERFGFPVLNAEIPITRVRSFRIMEEAGFVRRERIRNPGMYQIVNGELEGEPLTPIQRVSLTSLGRTAVVGEALYDGHFVLREALEPVNPLIIVPPEAVRKRDEQA